MYKNILLPLDGSKVAEENVQTAINLAKALDGRLILFQVIEILPLLREDRESESKILKERSRKYLDQIKTDIEESDVDTEIVIKTGKADIGICRYAEKEDIDLIIMSTHGLGGITNWAIGSVTDKVMRHAPKPVLLLRTAKSPLQDKVILAVDDEIDVLETIEEELDMCTVVKATDYEMASNLIKSRYFDIVILDIMGVNGFELLKKSVARDYVTIMLTAHSLTPEAFEKSAKLGAVSFLPKEKITDLEAILGDLIKSGGKGGFKKLFDRFGNYFDKIFGWGAKEQNTFINELEEIVNRRKN